MVFIIRCIFLVQYCVLNNALNLKLYLKVLLKTFEIYEYLRQRTTMSEDEKMITSEDEHSSSSDDSGDEKENEMEKRAAALELDLSENMTLYETHVELVGLYRKLADLNSMKAAYERFAKHFPLTPEIWLEWLKDEIKFSDKTRVLSLFKKAVDDYMSVNLWLEYVQYCIGHCELEETYSVFNTGLNAVGLNVSEGSLLWDSLRVFESAHLSLHEPLSEKWHQQAEKLFNAYKRQLSVPLLNMENTYIEFELWLQQLPEGHKIDGKSLEWSYKNASKLLTKYEPFEDQLLAAKGGSPEELHTIYKEYVKVIENPSAILCLYERAVAQLSLFVPIWEDYCLYAMKFDDVAIRASERSVRNCSWSEDLWILRLRLMEYRNFSNQDVNECFEKGLTQVITTPGLDLWLSYIEYVRRTTESKERLHKVFEAAFEYLDLTGDPSCKVLRLQARIYAKEGNIIKARHVWSQILKFPLYKTSATAWLEYISLEKQFGDTQKLRKLYQRALTCCTDWPDFISEDWTMYERECGTLQEVMTCAEKCKNLVKVKAAQTQVQVQQEEPKEDARKRKRDFNGTTDSSLKRTKLERPERSNAKDFKKKQFANESVEKPMKKTSIGDIDPEKSVFLSNMHEGTRENKIQEVFPNAVSICIPTDRTGTSRCFAYVQFETTAEVEAALQRDREPLENRPLFISKCQLDQTQRKAGFKYPTNAEKTKLFVRGLPLKYTQEDVESIFQPYNAVAVRLVTKRSGHSKGLAYVEFKNEEDTEKALKETDNTTVGGFIISVAFSEPPPKKPQSETSKSGPTFHPRSRLQIPLIPRSVKAKTATSSQEEAPKSNADFRNMLLKKN